MQNDEFYGTLEQRAMAKILFSILESFKNHSLAQKIYILEIAKRLAKMATDAKE